MALFGSDMNYGTAIKEWSPEEWQSFGARGGMIDGSMDLVEPSTGIGNYFSKQSLGDNATGLGVLFGSYDDLIGTGSKIKKEKLKGLKQDNELTGLNITSLKKSMADMDQFNKEAAETMNTAMRNKGLGTIGLSNGVKV